MVPADDAAASTPLRPVPPIIVPNGVILPPTNIPHPTSSSPAALPQETMRQIVQNRNAVLVFTALDGIFAAVAFWHSLFGGYVVTTIMCTVGYIGARDLSVSSLWLYAHYALVFALFCFAVILFGREVSDYAFLAMSVDGVLNCWVAARALQLQRCIEDARALGVSEDALRLEL